jgi:hypothetical protein
MEMPLISRTYVKQYGMDPASGEFDIIHTAIFIDVLPNFVFL